MRVFIQTAEGFIAMRTFDDRPISVAFGFFSIGNSGQWERGARLGQGHFGTVYQYTNSRTGEKHAVKEIEKGDYDVSLQEYNILKTLRHENVVKCFFCKEDDEKVYIHMELMKTTVKHQVDESGGLDDRTTAKYTIQILQGLVYLHGKGVVHRDLKCDNVLLDDSGTAKLADMGLSKYCNRSVSYGEDYPGQGAIYWRSPEALLNTKAERRADIWSLGCTVYEMLHTGPPLHTVQPVRDFIQKAIRMAHATEVRDDTSMNPILREFLQRIFVRLGDRPYAPELLDIARRSFSTLCPSCRSCTLIVIFR